MLRTDSTGGEVDDGETPELRRVLEQVERDAQLFGERVDLGLVHGGGERDLALDAARVPHRLHHVTCRQRHSHCVTRFGHNNRGSQVQSRVCSGHAGALGVNTLDSAFRAKVLFPRV